MIVEEGFVDENETISNLQSDIKDFNDECDLKDISDDTYKTDSDLKLKEIKVSDDKIENIFDKSQRTENNCNR